MNLDPLLQLAKQLQAEQARKQQNAPLPSASVVHAQYDCHFGYDFQRWSQVASGVTIPNGGINCRVGDIPKTLVKKTVWCETFFTDDTGGTVPSNAIAYKVTLQGFKSDGQKAFEQNFGYGYDGQPVTGNPTIPSATTERISNLVGPGTAQQGPSFWQKDGMCLFVRAAGAPNSTLVFSHTLTMMSDVTSIVFFNAGLSEIYAGAGQPWMNMFLAVLSMRP